MDKNRITIILKDEIDENKVMQFCKQHHLAFTYLPSESPKPPEAIRHVSVPVPKRYGKSYTIHPGIRPNRDGFSARAIMLDNLSKNGKMSQEDLIASMPEQWQKFRFADPYHKNMGAKHIIRTADNELQITKSGERALNEYKSNYGLKPSTERNDEP